MTPHSQTDRTAHCSVPARLLGPLQRATLSALMSSAVIILERRIRTTLRRGERADRRTPADKSAKPRAADPGIQARR